MFLKENIFKIFVNEILKTFQGNYFSKTCTYLVVKNNCMS